MSNSSGTSTPASGELFRLVADAVATAPQAHCDEPMGSKLDRREIDAITLAIIPLIAEHTEAQIVAEGKRVVALLESASILDQFILAIEAGDYKENQ